MIEGDCNVQLDFVSPSIYESHRFKNETGTVKKNKEKKTGVASRDKIVHGNGHQAAINGVRQGVMSSAFNSNMPPSTSVPEPNINLSREELLKLLSVFEGELQARDEVIEILKSERTNNPGLQERYGLSNMPLQALQRDAATLDATTKDHVAEQTKENLQKIIQHQKESYKKLKQALLAAEQANQRLAVEVTEEKRKHQDYMLKSDDFVNLLEDERERLKDALEKEKSITENREREANRKLKTNKEELSKLKSLSLVLVEERQQQVSELAEHKKQIADLERRLKESETKCKETESEINAEKDHAVQLENDLETQSNKFFQVQEDLKSKLEEEEQKNLQLEEKIKTMTHQLKRLKCVDKNLRKTDDQLWRIREKLEKDEEHDSLLEEVELLRERVKDMEEAEKIYTQAQEDCKDIRQKLEDELTMTRSLRTQLKTLQTQVKNQKDLQRTIEDTDFRFDELQLKFDFEKRKSNDMKEQLLKMKTRMTELDDFEKVLKEGETKISKQKEKIVLLTNEKKCSDEQVKFLIDKNLQLKNEIKDDKHSVTDITEKLIQESKKVLKLREELAQEKQKFSSELNSLEVKLKQEEDKNKELTSAKQTMAEQANDRLRRQVIMLKARLDQLEAENEQKDKQLIEAQKPGRPALKMEQEISPDIVDMVKQLKVVEERCEKLSEQLHSKSKLCEDLKKQLSKAKQANNNNCNLKGVSVESTHTQTENVAGGVKGFTSSKSSTESEHMNTSTSLKKSQSNFKLTATKVLPSPSTVHTNPGSKPSNSWLSNKPPMSPTSTLTRMHKPVVTAPTTFRLGRKITPSVTTSPLPAVEMTFTQEVGSASPNPATIKIVRDETGSPLIKTSGDSSMQAVAYKTAGDNKRVNVSNKDSKIPKQPPSVKPIRTFQVKKDFSELQKKWNSKINK